ncbi:MAG: hydroxymethylglutaryl-CoA reductase, degradative [Candidatus Diapherotrites archaeon]|nr:hydroxymethylglutaryl-CoA reductase, degradative [Candidatus Diapherotrites archaeon]
MASNISGFYKMSQEERLEVLKQNCKISDEELHLLKELKPMDFKTADIMIENVVGVFGLPLGIATNFVVNGKDYLIPMAIEESSVVAAASKAAKIARLSGGFKADANKQHMIGQIQIMVKGKKTNSVIKKIRANKKALLEKANACDKVLVSFGGGAKDLIIRHFEGFIVLHLIVDVRDAMGANAINTMCETIAPEIEKIANCRTGIKIISNLAVYRLAKAKAVFTKHLLEEESGKGIVDEIIKAWKFALADPYRAVTHNKGIMNGIDAIAIATGNDFRALEAGAHGYACIKGNYKPLTKYYKDKNGNLIGEITMPLQFGIVGGSTRVNPMAKLCLNILGVKSAQELAEVAASVGLAQNFAALYALSTKGIQYGHMKLHAKNIAVQAGAKNYEIDAVAEAMISSKSINEASAKEILKKIRRDTL